MQLRESELRLSEILRQLRAVPPGHSWSERAELCQEALSLLPREAAPQYWSVLKSELGAALLRRADGDPEAVSESDIEAAILAFETALEIQDEEEMPVVWAQTQVNLALALRRRKKGDVCENVERALVAYGEALRVRTREAVPAEWAATMAHFAATLQERQLGSVTDNLQKAMEVYEKVLEVFSLETAPRGWASTRINMAYLHCDLMEQCALEDLSSRKGSRESAIAAFEDGLQHLPKNSAARDWAAASMNYGSLLLNQGGGAGSEATERGIAAYREADSLFGKIDQPLERARVLSQLAGALTLRQTGSRSDNLEEAITTARAALEILAEDSPGAERAAALTHLGHACRHRILGTRAENQDQARKAYQAAADLWDRELFPLEWARATIHLANIWQEFRAGDKESNVERALDLYSQAQNEIDRDDDPLDWAGLKLNIGNALVERIAGRREENLQQAMAAYDEAREVFSFDESSEDWSGAVNNLANTHRLLGTPESYEEAIKLYEEALSVRAREAFPREWAQTTTNLGIVYRDRPRGDRPDNLERAIALFEASARVQAENGDTLDWAASQMNLGSALIERLLGTPELNHERAIAVLWQSIEVFTEHEDAVLRATALMHLGNAFLQRARGKETENIEVALGCFEQVLEVQTRESNPIDWANTLVNFASACGQRQTGNPKETVIQGLRACAGALKVFRPELNPREWSMALTSRALLLARRGDVDGAEKDFWRVLDVLDRDEFPAERSQIAQRLADFFFEAGNWNRAVAAYRIAGEAAVRLYQGTASPLGREAEVARARDLYRRTAYALARSGAVDEAVQVLEGVRGRRLEGILGRSAVSLEGLAKGLEPDCVLIYLITVEPGSLALLVRPGTGQAENPRVEAIWVDSFTASDLNRLLMQWQGGRLAAGLVHALFIERSSLRPVLAKVLPEVGRALAAPLAEELRKRRVRGLVLIPTGLLSLLPVHAVSWSSEGRTCTLLDHFEVSYVPSALALEVALEQRVARVREEVELTGVGNPLPKRRPLRFGSMELQEVVGAFGSVSSRTLLGQSASLSNLKDRLAGSTYLHLSCHGTFDSWEPRRSHLQLAGEDRWLLADILESQDALASVRLVVLSACETALAEFQNHPDEVLGFPVGFLDAGVPGVIGTLWSVEELSTVLLLRAFYRFHVGRDSFSGTVIEPGAALRRAQLWLRQVDAGTLVGFFSGEVEMLGSRLSRDIDPEMEELLDQAMTLFLLEESEFRPFEHPYYWAGFVFVGV